MSSPIPHDASVATGVYVHFPWCIRKCPYCDFATEPRAADALPQRDFTDALLREIELRAATMSEPSRVLASVFFGGGTPSLWEPSLVGEVLAAIRSTFAHESEALEVTAECNPSSLPESRVDALLEAGVNRISLGVQSLHNSHLMFLGRLHDRTMALDAVRGAVARCPRVSADLMFGMPRHTPQQLEHDVNELLDLGVRHLSVYALTIEPGTPFGAQHRRGTLKVSHDDRYADLYERARDTLIGRGFEHYEVSNYCAPGEASRHNAHYWRGGDYIGLGPSAVGCVTIEPGRARRWKNVVAPQRYMSSTSNTLGALETEVEWLSADELLREHWMLGLRTSEGVRLDATQARIGIDPWDHRHDVITQLQQDGTIDVDAEERTITVPHNHWFNLDGIVLKLF